MKSLGNIGFIYTVEAIDRDGNLLSTETVKNKIPLEGINYLLNSSLCNGSQLPAWYLGLYTGDYVPQDADTAASLPALAGEFTAYDGTARKLFDHGGAANGTVHNAAARAEFTFTQDTAVRGGFISSAMGKGATAGVLVSVVKFAEPKSPGVGGVLRVTAGISLSS